jgi:hypothetical protein
MCSFLTSCTGKTKSLLSLCTVLFGRHVVGLHSSLRFFAIFLRGNSTLLSTDAIQHQPVVWESDVENLIRHCALKSVFSRNRNLKDHDYVLSLSSGERVLGVYILLGG